MLEGVLLKEPSVKYPVCLAGARACPPEDCGGIPGYENLLEVLSNPKSSECKETVAWLKGHAKNYFPYHSEHFSPEEVEFWSPAKRWKMAFGPGGCCWRE